jgi:hypothetical protein
MKKVDPDVKVYYSMANEMYHEKIREGRALYFKQGSIFSKASIDDLIMEINKKINST